ncbi:MAG: FAD-dependent oxidoreductase [Thermoprotei archaeon]
MESSKGVVVVGGGAAGMSAASRVRRLDPDAKITVLESTEFVSHAPCGIPYYLEGLFSDASLFMNYTPEFFRQKRRIDVLTKAEFLEANFGSKQVRYKIGDENKVIEYDKLILATGAIPVAPDIPGIGGRKVFFVHHPAEAQHLRDALQGVSSIVIVGGGILGVELSEAFSATGKKVTLIHRGPYPLNRTLDQDLGHYVSSLIGGKINLRLNESVEALKEDGRSVKTNSGTYEAQATILAIGVKPNVRVNGLALGAHGAISTDEHMETSMKDVYAAGDVAESKNLITGKPDWQPYAPVANKMGFVAGANAAGQSMKFRGVLGTVITKFYEKFIAKTGLNEAEAGKAGLKTISTTIKTESRARYYPGGKETLVTLIADEASKKLIGGQIIGEEEVLGRLDLLASAITQGMTAEDLFFVEMGYMPAITEVWDPLIIAARQLMKE